MNAPRARNVFVALLSLVSVPLLADWDEGVAAFQAGRYQEAAGEFRTVVEQSPDAPEGHYMLGMSLLRLRQTAASLEPLARAVELGNGDPRYRLALGQAQLQDGKADAALATLAGQAPSTVPAAAREAYGQLLAKAAIESGRHDAALAALDEAAGVDRGSKSLWLAIAHVANQADDEARAFAALSTAFGLDRSDADLGRRAVHTAFAVAQRQSDEGARASWYEKGYELARQWAEASPSSEAHLLAGQAKMGARDYAGARPWLAKAAEASPADARPVYYQARCALALEEPSAALELVAQGLARSPDDELRRQLLETRGTAHRHREEFTEAAAAFREAGNAEKVAEMERYAKAQDQNELFAREREECRARLAALDQLKEESKDLEGTDAWRELVADYDRVAAACAEHLKGDG